MPRDAVDPSSLSTGWAELLSEFTDEVDRLPSNAELAELLTLAVRSVADRLSDLPANATVESAVAVRGRSIVPELNDAAYELATALTSDAVSLLTAVTGPPSAQSVLDLLADALARARRGDEVRGAGGWRLRSGPPRIRLRVGDIVAVPLAHQKYRYLVAVARTDFGTAFGVLQGLHGLRWGTGSLRPTAFPPVYAGTEEIQNGRWPIVGHEANLLDAFDRDPEVYHKPRPGHALIGPFGSAERAGGAMRDLTEEEAREIGLLDSTYVIGFMPSELQGWLRRLDS